MARLLLSVASLCIHAAVGNRATLKTEAATDATSFDIAATVEGPEKEKDPREEALKSLRKETKMGSCKACHGMLIGNLVEGLYRSGLTESIAYVDHTLQVTLNVKQAYGQVASSSRIPNMWVVDKDFSAEYSKSETGETTVHVHGLSMETPRQAQELYEAMLAEGQIGTSGGGWMSSSKPVHAPYDMVEEAQKFHTYCPGDKCQEYLEAERLAARYYLANHDAELQRGDGKISKVLRSIKSAGMVVSSMIGEDNWGSIFYSMIGSAPRSLVVLEFNRDGLVLAKTAANPASPSHEHAEKYSLKEKGSIIGTKSITNCPPSLAKMAAQQAKSGWGLGMMFAHGSPEVAPAVQGYPKADPNHLVNLFSLCAEGGDATEDPPCKGSTPGRVHWTAEPAPLFL